MTSSLGSECLALFDAMIEPVALCSPDGTIKYANPAMAALLGSPTSLNGRFGDALRSGIDRVRDSNERHCIEAFDPAGTRWYDVEIYAVAGSIWLVGHDVSTRKQVLENLRQLVESSPYAIAMLDRDMRYLYVSKRWLADYRLDVTAESIRGRSHYDVFPEISDEWKAIHRRCLAGEVAKHDAEPFPRADGATDWVRWEIRPWTDDGGRIGGLLIFSEDITVKKRAEDELRRWEYLFENASWGMTVATPENRFIRVNRAFAAMHGTTPEHWVGRSLLDMFAEESKALLPDLVREAHEVGHVQYDSIHARSDGGTFPVRTEVTAFKDSSGQVLFRAGNFHDITEHKRIEAELELQRTKLHALLQGAPFAVVVYDGPQHVASYSNPAHDEMTAGRIVIGKPLLESLPELAGTQVMAVLDDVYRTGRTHTVRELHTPLMRNGRLEDRWFDVTWQAIPDLHGHTSILVSAVEVTAHVTTRHQVEAAHRLTNVITSNASLGLLMMDARQHCTFMNPAAEDITGYRLDEVQGRPLHDVIHHSHPDGTPYPMDECPIDRALPTKNQQRGEDVFIRRDGTCYPVAFTASPIVENGAPVGTVIELRDTAAEKAAQAELERILDDLRTAVAARDEFLSIASHELRTPITALQLQIEGARRHVDDSEQLCRKLGVIERQSDRLTTLVEALLNVSRIMAGRFRLDVEELDLCVLIREVVERFEEEAAHAGTQVVLHLPASAIGTWDRSRLDQALANLVSNAIKYGGGKPIEIRLDAAGDDVQISVRDQGIGIADDDVSRIFGRFERAVSAKHYGGLGLGLYITRQIVAAHGGTINVTTALGQGSTFVITIPRHVAVARRDSTRMEAHA